MIIDVCVGSSCHLKGSYEVIQKIQDLIKENDLGSKVAVKASFCLGNCSKGVSMKIDDEPIYNVTPNSIKDIFYEKVMNKV